MGKTEQILALLRNKSKRINLALNPDLWDIFEKLTEKDGLSPSQKVEELLILYLESSGQFDEK